MSELILVDKSLVENAVCTDVTSNEIEELIVLGQKMIEFCVDNGGLGLAAPQIGVYKKMFVWSVGEERFQIAFNPIYYGSGRTNSIEGCLTYKGCSYYMTRFKDIRAICYGHKDGSLYKTTYHLTGEKSILFQHECDHVNNEKKSEFESIGKTINQLGTLIDEGWN